MEEVAELLDVGRIPGEMNRRRPCVVEPWGLDRDADLALLRQLVSVVATDVVQVQTDLPLDQRARCPADVTAAAELLRSRSRRHRGDSDTYATTGWLRVADDPQVWPAFVAVAPWAYDAMAWDARGELLDLADEARSFRLHLRPEQRARAADLVAPRALVDARASGSRTGRAR